MRYGQYFETSIGKLYLEVEEGCLVRLAGCGGDGSGTAGYSGEESAAEQEAPDKPDTVTVELMERVMGEVAEYLDGKRAVFDIPIHTEGTYFQEKVWAALREIPYGETRTYGEIARAVGSPGGARAVGMACNRNPVLLLTPCHRVIGGTGKLVGFAGGLEVKKHLLELEGADIG